jgi:hypothetical protein
MARKDGKVLRIHDADFCYHLISAIVQLYVLFEANNFKIP